MHCRKPGSVDLIVRDLHVRPSVWDYPENIRVRSVVGRFLEHSRALFRERRRRRFISAGKLDGTSLACIEVVACS